MSKTAEGCAEDSSAKVLMASHLDASVQTGHWNVTLECSGDLRRTSLRGILAFEMLDKTKDAMLRGTLERVFSVVRKNRRRHPYGKITIYDSSKQHGASTGMVKQISIAWDNISPFGWERCNDLRFIIDCVFEMPAYDPMAYTDQEAWVRSNTETVCRCTMERIVRLGNMEYSDISPHWIFPPSRHLQLYDNSLNFTVFAMLSKDSDSRVYAHIKAAMRNDGRYVFKALELLVRIHDDEFNRVRCSDIHRRKDHTAARALTITCDNAMRIQGVGVDTFMCNESQYITPDEVEHNGDGFVYAEGSSAPPGFFMTDSECEELFRGHNNRAAISAEQMAQFVLDNNDDGVDEFLTRRHNSLCPTDANVPPEIIGTWGTWNTFFIRPEVTSQIVDSMNSESQQGFNEQQVTTIAKHVMTECLNQTYNAFNIFK